MNKPNLIKLLVLAEDYQTKAKQTAALNSVMPSKDRANQQYQAQRERLAAFSSHFTSKCRAILGEMSGDIFTLRERRFPTKWLGMLKQLRMELETICKKFDASKPYVTAYELTDHVLDRPVRVLIENLEFQAKHHLEQTKPRENLLPFAVHADVHSLGRLLDFAYSTRAYMDANPLLYAPTFSVMPPQRNPAANPALLADPDEKTNAPETTEVLTGTPAA